MLTGAMVFSFMEQPVESKSKSLAQILTEPIERHPNSGAERGPANIDGKKLEPVGSSSSRKKEQKLALKIFCVPGDLKINSDQHLVMLELSSCADLKEKHQLWVKNETNGFKAQIFRLEDSKFKTDFIQLNKGANKLSLEGILKDGQKVVQTLEILSGS